MSSLARFCSAALFAGTISLLYCSTASAQLSYVYVPQDASLVNIPESPIAAGGSLFYAQVRNPQTQVISPVLFDAATAQFKTIPPVGTRVPTVKAISGSTMVGWSTRNSTNNAYIWNITTQTATSLHKTGNTHTAANDFKGNLVVGSRYSYNYNNNRMEYKAVKWNAATQEMTDLDMTGHVTTQALYTDGAAIAGVSDSGGLVVWDAQTGAQRAMNLSGVSTTAGDTTPASGLSGVQTVGISLNRVVGQGDYFNPYSGSRGYVWDTTTGVRTMLQSLGNGTYDYVDGVFGKYAYGDSSAAQTATSAAWDITTGQAISFAGGSNVGTRAIGGHGDILVGGNYGNTAAYAWDLRTGVRTDLHSAFVPGGHSSSQTYAVSDTGVILGRANGNSYSGTNATLFALVPFSSTAPAKVGAGQTATNTGNFTQTGGAAVINGAMRFSDAGSNTYTLAGGTLGGSGTITGNLLNTGGTVAPGNSPGTLNVVGSYTQGAGGTFAVEITGTGAGQFDVLNVIGTATLAGSLSALPSGYTPSVGTFFDVLTTTGGISGTFGTITPGWAFSTVNGGNTGRLTFNGAAVVPETGSLWLVALGGAAIAGGARRRN